MIYGLNLALELRATKLILKINNHLMSIKIDFTKILDKCE